MGFPKGRYIMAGASIITVGAYRNPSAIIRLIVAIVVDAIQGEMIGISVLQSPFFETVSAVSPILADGDSSAAIPIEKHIPGIGTPLDHVAMDDVKSASHRSPSFHMKCGMAP